MKKTFKIFMFVTLFLIIFITTVSATGISMNLDDYIPNTSEVENIVSETNSLLTDETEIEDEDDSPRVVSTSTSSDDEFLTAENVLSIIIIVIGLLLVFLAIAILIRIK